MNKPLLVFQAPCFSRSGYGDHARDILKSLFDVDKYDVKVVPTRWGNTPLDQVSPNTEFGKKTLENIVTKVDRKPDIFIQMSVANEFEPKGNYNIGITAGVETTVIPKEFIDGSNKMDLVIVPSEFTKSLFEKTQFQEQDNKTKQVLRTFKTETPIEVLFEGVDINTYCKPIKKPKTDILENIDTDFNFLFVGHWLKGNLGQDRKDVGMLIKTFSTVFKYLPKDKRPGLILKTSHAGFSVIDRETTRKKIEAITKGMDDVPPIYLLHGDLKDTEMAELYNHTKVKAMVSFTKGEGYGRPLAEFATTGKPIMVSNWSGHLDFLPKEHTILLDGQLTSVDKSASDKFLLPESKWFTVNYSDAANKLYQLYNDYDTFVKKSAGLKSNILNNFTLDKMTDVLGTMLDKYVKNQPIQKPFNLPKLNPQKEVKLPKLNKL